MKTDKFTGRSTCEYETGEYCGNFVNGVRQGHGTMTFSNHDIYDGEWKDGKMHGIGTYRFWNKREDRYVQVYEGSFSEGKRNGNGRMKFSNHDVYEGTWQNDFCWFADGSIFHGIWKFDKMLRGVYRSSNGEFYDGELKDGLFHGYGKLFYTDGKWFEGVFKNGEPSKGKLFTTDGEIHEIEDGIR